METKGDNMVCPVCVVGGIGFVLSRVFGLPDVVVAFVIGMLATSMAYCSTSPTGLENHLASFRFQNTFLLNV